MSGFEDTEARREEWSHVIGVGVRDALLLLGERPPSGEKYERLAEAIYELAMEIGRPETGIVLLMLGREACYGERARIGT